MVVQPDTLSDEIMALIEAEKLILAHMTMLYVGKSPYECLPQDTATQAAFSALVGARKYIQKTTRTLVVGNGRADG